jgi:hypothetical protein
MALGTGIACRLADIAGGTDDVAALCCSTMQRKPHLGQNLDLCGRGSRQCGHSIAPQFLHNGCPGGICEWQTEHRLILGGTLLSISDYFVPSSFFCFLLSFVEHSEYLIYYTLS